MAMRNILHCFICPAALPPRLMVRLVGDENADKCAIAQQRRLANIRPIIEINELTRICASCNRSIIREINALQRDPACLRLNVLTQSSSHSCLICNSPNEPRLSTEARVNIFLNRDIYVPEYVKSCAHHLNGNGFLLQRLLPGLRFVNRPYVIPGRELQTFLKHLRNTANEHPKIDSEDYFSDADFESIALSRKFSLEVYMIFAILYR
ncbi:unnamed protein product [Ceutorhynchus assimilis]|uniref:Uncharacterized protein n=1 Tax=Ceutorhynchus assimilis TaxID=467358 RepID=A0A9N9N1P1_9CUCU|nr:unnamed protein product [Ceutorhynchus assimilis]